MTHRLLQHFALTILALALLFGAAAGLRAEGTISLKGRVELTDSELRLSDLFVGLPVEADRAVAQAPAPGKSVELDARWLYALARNHGIDWRPASSLDRSIVTRLSRTLGAAEVRAALGPALADRGAPQEMSILLDNPAIALRLPLESLAELTVAKIAYDRTGGRFRAQLVAADGEQAAGKASVSGRVVRMSEVPVLRQRMRPGDVIGADDIEWQTQRSDRIGAQVLLDPADIVGFTPRRVLRAGEPVRSGSLRPPVLVAKNSLVTLRVASDRMVLTAQGKALEDGGRNQVIRVVNTHSKVIVSGIVTAEGAVSVSESTGQP